MLVKQQYPDEAQNLISCWSFIDVSVPEDLYFCSINTYDINYIYTLYEADNLGNDKLDNVVANDYLNYDKSMQKLSTITFENALAAEYFYDRDFGNDIVLPTKCLIVIKNRKAYHIEVAAINVDNWYQKIISSISIPDKGVL